MRSNFNESIFFGAVLLHLVFLDAVQSATLATDQQKEKFGKPGKKATDWWKPEKKTSNKEFPSYEVTTQYGRNNLAEVVSVYDAEPRLMPSKDQDFNSSSADDKKRDEGQLQKLVNRLKRKVSTSISPPFEIHYVYSTGQTSNQTSKNYKKLKQAESLALSKSSDSRRKDLSKKNSGVWDPRRLKRDGIAETNKVGLGLRGNASDYYAQRQAVMDRFYTRQRQISERLAHQSTSTSRSVFWSDLKLNFGDETSRTTTTVGYNYLPQEEIANTNLMNNNSNPGPRSASGVAVKKQDPDLGVTQLNHLIDNYEPDVGNHLSRTSNNVEREAPFNNPVNCDNIPRSGSYATKRNSSRSKSCIDNQRGDMVASADERATDTSGTGNKQWGTCTGKVVYQHNLLLGVKGPSNLNTRFEVAIQGPICITCVEILRYNNTRATVTLEAGGRGHQFITLRLKGFENEGFSYIVKVWGIRKTASQCEK